MCNLHFAILTLLILMLACGCVIAGDTDEQLSGLITGKTGELLEIKLTQPVMDGTIFRIKPVLSEPPIAEARVVSCTKEWPFIALAKIAASDLKTSIPIGSKAFADIRYVESHVAPKPIKHNLNMDSGQRFSIQIGSFYPRLPILRDTVADFWQAYRFNYTVLRLGDFDAMISAEYTKGS